MNEIFKTLGEELARQRQEKELSIAQLAVRTKIAEGFLEKMEQGDFGFLPPVYVRAFIRSVSAEIGLDPEVMMRRFSDEATRLSGAASGPAVERRTEPPADNSSFKPPTTPPSSPGLRMCLRPTNPGRTRGLTWSGSRVLSPWGSC